MRSDTYGCEINKKHVWVKVDICQNKYLQSLGENDEITSYLKSYLYNFDDKVTVC